MNILACKRVELLLFFTLTLIFFAVLCPLLFFVDNKGSLDTMFMVFAYAAGVLIVLAVLTEIFMVVELRGRGTLNMLAIWLFFFSLTMAELSYIYFAFVRLDAVNAGEVINLFIVTPAPATTTTIRPRVDAFNQLLPHVIFGGIVWVELAVLIVLVLVFDFWWPARVWVARDVTKNKPKVTGGSM